MHHVIPICSPEIQKELYRDQGIDDTNRALFLCIVNSQYHIEDHTEGSIIERPCIFLQLYGGDMKKKKKCCKNYKKDKQCKSCPRD